MACLHFDQVEVGDLICFPHNGLRHVGFVETVIVENGLRKAITIVKNRYLSRSVYGGVAFEKLSSLPAKKR